MFGRQKDQEVVRLIVIGVILRHRRSDLRGCFDLLRPPFFLFLTRLMSSSEASSSMQSRSVT